MSDCFLQKNERKSIILINPDEDYNMRFVQAENSVLNIFFVQVASNSINFNHCIEIEQEGSNAQTGIYGLNCVSDVANITFTTLIRHTVPNGQSSQIFKYILKDRSQGKFDGRVIISPDAQNTNVSQVNKNILLTSSAKMETCPQLEIYADDVKASHGATIGQLDEMAVFYMRQRGIDSKVAHALLLHAFVDEIMQRIPNIEEGQKAMEVVDEFMNNL